jgi:hypothetical protein
MIRIKTKIFFGFFVIIVLCFSQLIVVYQAQNKIIDKTRTIKEVEAKLELMSEQVIGDDATLTGQVHLALLYALKGDYKSIKEHQDKYNEVGINLDNLLKEDAITLINQSQRAPEIKRQNIKIIKDLDILNLKLVDLETRAFAAMNNKDTDTAYSLVVGGDYEVLKYQLYQKYKLWSEIEHNLTNSLRNSILKDSHWLVIFNLCVLITQTILVLVLLILLTRLFTSINETKNNQAKLKKK